jgi:hypothetical protein
MNVQPVTKGDRTTRIITKMYGRLDKARQSAFRSWAMESTKGRGSPERLIICVNFHSKVMRRRAEHRCVQIGNHYNRVRRKIKCPVSKVFKQGAAQFRRGATRFFFPNSGRSLIQFLAKGSEQRMSWKLYFRGSSASLGLW